MKPKRGQRGRMMFDVTPETQMAIKLHAVRHFVSTSEVLAQMVEATLQKDLIDARKALREQEKGGDVK